MREVILFDGECGLCNRLNLFVLKRDKDARFCFAPLQGEYARAKLLKHDEDPDTLNTFYLVLNEGTPKERVLRKSEAALYVARHLPGGWRLFSWLRMVVPRKLRDAAYDVVARHRHRLFRSAPHCAMPQPHWQARFITSDSSPQNRPPIKEEP